MGRSNISLSPWGVTGGAVNSRVTDADLAWFERTIFVSVRDRRDPAALASECFGASPWGKLVRDTNGHAETLPLLPPSAYPIAGGRVRERHAGRAETPALRPPNVLVQRRGGGLENVTRGKRDFKLGFIERSGIFKLGFGGRTNVVSCRDRRPRRSVYGRFVIAKPLWDGPSGTVQCSMIVYR